MNKHFNIYQETGERFYRVPKVFTTSERYFKMRNDSKLAYAILQDRIELSIKNNWVDKKGNIYFIYTNKNLVDILNYSEPTVIKIKKELTDLGLLTQKRQGLNKPNMLYLLKPEVTDTDIYRMEKKDNIGHEVNNDKELKDVKFQNTNNLSTKTKNYSVQELNNFKPNDTELSNTDFNETELNDMNNTNNTSHSNHSHSNQNSNWVKDHQKDNILNKYPKEITIHLYNLPVDEAKEILSVMNKAKKNATAGIGKTLMPNFDFTHETHAGELGNIIRRVTNEAKINSKSIKSYSPYLMKSFINYYTSYWEPIMSQIIEEDMHEASTNLNQN